MDWSLSRDVDTTQRGDPRIIGVDDESMDEVLDALSSDTARTILSEIYSNAVTPSEIRDRTDLSLQTISYHLSNLQDAALIQVAETEYSEKGREMNVYAPADDPCVVFVGTQERKSGSATYSNGCSAQEYSFWARQRSFLSRPSVSLRRRGRERRAVASPKTDSPGSCSEECLSSRWSFSGACGRDIGNRHDRFKSVLSLRCVLDMTERRCIDDR